MEKLYQNGINNEFHGLKMLTAREVSKMAPEVKSNGAIFSKETGILSSHSLMTYLYDSILKNAVTTAFKTRFIRGEKITQGYRLYVKDTDDSDFSFTCKFAINAAGLFSDRVAESFGIDIKKAGYELNFAKGCYVSYSGKSLNTRYLIYPLPSPEYLGIHSVIDLGGRYRFGPDIQFMKDKQEDYSIRDGTIPNFYREIKKYFPQIEEQNLRPDFCGIRPKLAGAGQESRDFIINEETEKNLPGLINLIGIESPGLTSCTAIASYIEQLLNFK